MDWFVSKLASPDCEFLVGEQDGRPVGVLRMDRRADEWEVSIVVAPEVRSRGFGKAMLSAVIRGRRHLVAEVLPGNEHSHELFRSCGWRLAGDGLYRPGL
jgi:RimJ/RimL family protein N-acetyltransferase